MNVETWLVTERDGTEYYWSIKGYFSTYVPAKTWGRFEDCYPAEGGELEKVETDLVHIDYGFGVEEPFYYHHCHLQEPTDEQVQVALWEQYEKEVKCGRK